MTRQEISSANDIFICAKQATAFRCRLFDCLRLMFVKPDQNSAKGLELTTLAHKWGVLSFLGCLRYRYAKYYIICIICSFFRKGKLYRTLHNHPQNTTFFQKHHILPMSSEKSLNLLQEFINSRAACGDNQNYSIFFTAAKPPISTLHSSL